LDEEGVDDWDELRGKNEGGGEEEESSSSAARALTEDTEEKAARMYETESLAGPSLGLKDPRPCSSQKNDLVCGDERKWVGQT
jgi:hypothetical protein